MWTVTVHLSKFLPEENPNTPSSAWRHIAYTPPVFAFAFYARTPYIYHKMCNDFDGQHHIHYSLQFQHLVAAAVVVFLTIHVHNFKCTRTSLQRTHTKMLRCLKFTSDKCTSIIWKVKKTKRSNT